ncbi:hypothetical protein SAMN05421847_0825 [Halpernia humi]|uniref:ABC transporter ATPase n=1 Tax=Halpernia humi TaxID=493375 RepID=A0A1H5UK72_9FLAO|nr:hypothetical protein [Halpernia humi]SEF75473.1 hypothetical protein SAMN05421847_0825 [Halpernia humi]
MKIEDATSVEVNDYRVIVFPASRPFTALEAKKITEYLYDFLPTWAAHGKPLSASFKIEKNQFVVVCVDEDKELASGCSIDALSGIMRNLDGEFQLGFFDRMKASFIENGEVKTLKLQDFRAKIKSRELSDDIEVFDFSKDSYLNFLNEFLLPLKESWAKIYLD